MSLNILFVGETNIVYLTEHKGLDSFTQTRYTEYASVFSKVLTGQGHRVTHIPCHLVHTEFPATLEALQAYDVIILSDIGANTMLLHPDSFNRTVNTLQLIKDYVAAGGGFVMIGGYLSFAGIEGKARYHRTAIEELLPVRIQPYDDRVETPEGMTIRIMGTAHPILDGLPNVMPHVFGYNRVEAKPGATTLVESDIGDPIIVAGAYGKGRAIAYTTDCVQDWASPELLAWPHYGPLWGRLLNWAAGDGGQGLVS